MIRSHLLSSAGCSETAAEAELQSPLQLLHSTNWSSSFKVYIISTFSFSHIHTSWWIQALRYLLWSSPMISCCFKPRGRAWTTPGGRWASVRGQTEEWFLHRSGQLRLGAALRLSLLGVEARLDGAARWARPHCLWCWAHQVHHHLNQRTNFWKVHKTINIKSFHCTPELLTVYYIYVTLSLKCQLFSTVSPLSVIIFSYASSSTLYPCQWVSKWLIKWAEFRTSVAEACELVVFAVGPFLPMWVRFFWENGKKNCLTAIKS